MNGILITLGKEEIGDIVQMAVHTALKELGLNKEPEKEDLMSLSETCSLLNIKPNAMYYKTHKKEIPFMKKGKTLYFSRAEITAWVQSGRKYTIAENERIADEKLRKLNSKK